MIGDAIVFDGHVDTPLRIAEGIDIRERQNDTHLDLPRTREGGLDAVFMAAWIDPAYGPDRSFERARALIEIGMETAERGPGTVFARTAGEVRSAAADGRLAILAAVENGDALESDVGNVERLHALGARYLTLTWMHSNALGDAGGGERSHGGLSSFGHDVVDAMNDLGMLIDLSHAAPSTFDDVLERTRAPVVVSHSATEALGPHPRNVSDDQLRSLAINRGVIGINFFPAYLAPGQASAPWTAIVDHIDRVVAVAGVDHAALGSDFDGIPSLPGGMHGVDDLPLIAGELERRGYDADDRRKVLGENWLRVLAEVVDGRGG